MKNCLLKIGEMAELNHVSTQTLRLYAKNKLLEPEYLDPETGYRYYTLEQCAQLDLIRALKSYQSPRVSSIQSIKVFLAAAAALASSWRMSCRAPGSRQMVTFSIPVFIMRR